MDEFAGLIFRKHMLKYPNEAGPQMVANKTTQHSKSNAH